MLIQNAIIPARLGAVDGVPIVGQLVLGLNKAITPSHCLILSLQRVFHELSQGCLADISAKEKGTLACSA